MKKGFLFYYLLLVAPFSLFSQNAGVGTITPAGKLHVKESASTTQLMIDANSTQGNTNPVRELSKQNEELKK